MTNNEPANTPPAPVINVNTPATTSIWTKVGVAVVVIGLLAGLVYIVKLQHDLKTQQDVFQHEIEVKMKDLGDGITRSQSQFVSKDDLDKFTKLDLNKIQSDLDKLHAALQGVQVVVAHTPGSDQHNLPSSSVIPNGNNNNNNTGPVFCSDPYKYLTNAQVLNINEPIDQNTSAPFGSVVFSAFEDKPWSLYVSPRDYTVSSVLGQDPTGKHYLYNQVKITVDNKDYTLPIKTSKYEEVMPEPAFHLSPRVYLSVDAGTHFKPGQAELIPSVGVSIFSHGRTTVDPDWSIANIGVGYAVEAKKPVLTFAPVSYNIGHHLPLINNLHVGPAISIDSGGSLIGTIGVRVGL